MKTLLSALEFIQLSTVTKDFPPSKICSLIEAEEYAWFEKCSLGLDLYDALLDNLKEIPSNLDEWSALGTYQDTDFVRYYGVILKSKIDSNTVDPCTDRDETAWEIHQKFETTCVNSFWKSIAIALSYRIAADNATLLAYEMSGKGIMKYSEEFRQNTTGIISTDRGERVDYQNALQRQADKYYNTMISKLVRMYEKDNTSCDILFKATHIQNLCNTCAPDRTSRRIHYRN